MGFNQTKKRGKNGCQNGIKFGLKRPLNPRPLSDFTVHATLSSPPCGSRHEESIRRVLIASFDLRFNNSKCLRLQIHSVNPFLNPSTTIYHSIRVSLRQGGVSSRIKRASDGGIPPLYVAALERHIETDSAVTLDLGAFVAQITATIDRRGYSSKGGACLLF
ncbi:BnaC02g35060D [Brassica napus]|uniref:BnaC02g35060D protein n=1 Tax=Brassica napus TaxID=3708 RepID=A0A078HK19_BRANA|nr:BnaC02g35060D [Brassica napus]